MPRLIRLCGDPDPWQDPAVLRMVERGALPLDVAQRMRRFARFQRRPAVPGATEVILGPEHGFSKTYVFGPRQFAAWMEDADAALLMNNRWDRWRFLDVTDDPSRTERPPLGRAGWGRLLEDFSRLTVHRTLPGQDGADFRRGFRRRQPR